MICAMPQAGPKFKPQIVADFVRWIDHGAIDPRQAPDEGRTGAGNVVGNQPPATPAVVELSAAQVDGTADCGWKFFHSGRSFPGGALERGRTDAGTDRPIAARLPVEFRLC